MILIGEIQVKCEDNETSRDRARAWKRGDRGEKERACKGDRDKWGKEGRARRYEIFESRDTMTRVMQAEV